MINKLCFLMLLIGLTIGGLYSFNNSEKIKMNVNSSLSLFKNQAPLQSTDATITETKYQTLFKNSFLEIRKHNITKEELNTEISNFSQSMIYLTIIIFASSFLLYYILDFITGFIQFFNLKKRFLNE